MGDDETLGIEINASASGAIQTLETLAKKLESLGETARNTQIKISNISNGVKAVSSSVKEINKLNTTNLKKSLSGVEELIAPLKGLTNISFDKFNAGLLGFGETAELIGHTDLSGFFTSSEKIATSLTQLSNLGTNRLNSFVKSLSEVESVSKSLNNVNFLEFSDNVKSLATAIGPLSSVSSSSLGFFTNSLKQIPDINKSLDIKVVEEFARKINLITQAVIPLGHKLKEIESILDKMPDGLGNIIKGAITLNKQTERAAKLEKKAAEETAKRKKEMEEAVEKVTQPDFSGLPFKLIGLSTGIAAIKKLVEFIKKGTNSINDYIEHMNLFDTAMGSTRDTADAFIKKISGTLNLDPARMYEYMGIFQMLGTGFGIASDKAYILSKNLTQLGFDLASFYDKDYGEVMNNLRSGIAGEAEALRKYGIAIEEASLKEFAHSLNIEKSVHKMTQAEKAQLRYIAIMNQTQKAQGDMGKTITSSANSLRVLKQQFELLGRAIGSLFIPFLQQALPWLIAIVKVATMVVQALAKLLGFKMPTFKKNDGIKDISIGFDNAKDSATGAGKAAQKLKRQLAGFDELNNLTSPTPSSGGGGGGGAGGVGGPGLEFDLPEYDMLKDFDDRVKDLTKSVMDFFGLSIDALGNLKIRWKEMNKWAKLALIIVGAIFGTRMYRKIKSFVSGIKEVLGAIKAFSKTVFGLRLLHPVVKVFQDFGMAFKMLFKYFQGTASIERVGKAFGILGTRILKTTSLIGGAVLAFKGFGTIISTITKLKKDDLTVSQMQEVLAQNSIKTVAELTIGGFAIGAAFGPLGAMIGTAVGALSSFVANLIALKVAKEQIAEQEIFGDVELTKGQLETLSTAFRDGTEIQIKAVEDFNATIARNNGSMLNSIESTDGLIKSYELLGNTVHEVTSEDLEKGIGESIENISTKLKENTENTVSSFETLFGKSKHLSEDQKETIVKDYAEASTRKQGIIEDEKNEIVKIFEKAKAERRKLNNEEIAEVRKHYKKIADLAKEEVSDGGDRIDAELKRLNKNRQGLSKEALKQSLEALQKGMDEQQEVINTAYDKRSIEASKAAKIAKENAIANGKSLYEAEEEYQKRYSELMDTAEKERIEAQEKLNGQQFELKKQLHADIFRQYYEHTQGMHAAQTKENDEYVARLEKILTDAGFNEQEIIKISKEMAEQSTSAVNDNFKPDMKIPKPLFSFLDACNAGKEVTGAFNSGFSPNVNVPKPSYSYWDVWRAGAGMGGAFTSGFSSKKISIGGSIHGYNPSSKTYTGISDALQNYISGSITFKPYKFGGFPTIGEMFLARESGPELVGRMGNRTTVANNDQIVAGIEAGVYRAVTSAMSGNNGSNHFTINVGERTVFDGFIDGIASENNRYGTAVIEV